MVNATQLGEAILAATFTTTIAKTKTFQLPMAEFPVEAILEMLRHGAQRKFNDAVGGLERNGEAYTPEMKQADAAAMIADYKAGIISKRRESAAAVPDEVRVGRKLLRALLPAQLGKEGFAKFKAMEPEEQNAKLDGWLQANAEAFAKPIADAIEEERKAAKRKALLGNSMTFEL